VKGRASASECLNQLVVRPLMAVQTRTQSTSPTISEPDRRDRFANISSRPGAEIGERPVRGVRIRPTSERQERSVFGYTPFHDDSGINDSVTFPRIGGAEGSSIGRN
jgi:hypothetical protein